MASTRKMDMTHENWMGRKLRKKEDYLWVENIYGHTEKSYAINNNNINNNNNNHHHLE